MHLYTYIFTLFPTFLGLERMIPALDATSFDTAVGVELKDMSVYD